MIPTSTYLSYANGYLDLGMIKAAQNELDAIDESERSSDEVLAMQARLYLESENWEKLLEVSKRIATQSPKHPFAWVHWAYALRELDRNLEAKEIAIQGLKHHPDEATLWFNLACYCSLLGEVEQSAIHLNEAIKLDPDFEKEAAEDPDLTNLMNWKKATEGEA